MADVDVITGLITARQPLVALLAPSFPIMYRYPDIIGKIRRLGFVKVVEVSAGAAATNQALIAKLQGNPTLRVITSPCPSFVRMVRTKHPELLSFLSLDIDSPMAATARIAQQRFPGARPVFIGPCHAKKMEAKEDRAELSIIAITYLELETLFTKFGITDQASDATDAFDIAHGSTREYPVDGGLTNSSGIRSLLAPDEIRIVSGWKSCEAALKEFVETPRIRLLDVLFCEGGCIEGPGIVSPLSKEERTQRIVAYAKQ